MNWFTNRLLGLLDRDEHLAVEGDLLESGETGSQALRQVLGLVMRREAATCKSWRPWTALVPAFPLAKWLTHTARYTADHTSIYLWFYGHNWVPGYFTNAGARADLFRYLGQSLLLYAVLLVYSASIGCGFGCLAGRSVRIFGAVFCTLLLAMQFVPSRAATLRHDGNGAVFALPFFSVLFPLMTQLLAVMAPAVWAMRWGRRLTANLARPLALMVAAACCIHAADAPAVRASIEPVASRQSAPQIAITDSHGKTLKLDQYRGKVVLLDFWATWCHGCKEEIPWFEDFHKKYKSKGLAVVGVSLDGDGWKILKPFLKDKMRIPYRIALGDDGTAALYKIETMPDTFLIDREGRVAATYRGLVDRDDIEKNVQTLLK